MAIVIGAATTVSFMGACVISANWGYNPNAQRLYCLGSWTPNAIFYRPTESLNLSIYAPGQTYGTTPTTECADASSVSASVSPAACGGSFGDISGNWLVTSYSFSKEDAASPGTESWSLQKWKNVTAPPDGTSVEPTYVMRGITEGQGTTNAGVVFSGATTSTTTGSVSAGGFGKVDEVLIGTVSSVGGGTSAGGETGQGSVSIPYTPLYI